MHAMRVQIDRASPGVLDFLAGARSLFCWIPNSCIKCNPGRCHMANNMEGLLVMAGGVEVRGEGRGAPGIVTGELVFQTGMVGYQEALTDPSYAGQLLIFTYPLVGNYGAIRDANQSAGVHARGAIVGHLMPSGGHRD